MAFSRMSAHGEFMYKGPIHDIQLQYKSHKAPGGDEMTERCAQCGAMLPAGSTCQTLHEELLNFEYNNAIPHSIHFLHVT
jgi:hypothetical protein